MRYRRTTFILAFFVLNGLTHSDIKTEQDFLFAPDKTDVSAIINKGLIAHIAQALEGVASVTEDIFNTLLFPVKQLIKLDQKAIRENPHKHDVARVRVGGPLCDQELAFRKYRFPVVKSAQEKFFGMSLEDEDVLEITFSGSGGGQRANTCAFGACVGADKIGLLDTVMCMSGLSGTTWFLGPWVTSGLTLEQYKERAIQNLCDGIEPKSFADVNPIFDSFWTKFAFDQHLNFMDLFAALLANNMLRGLGPDQQMIYLSDQAQKIAHGDYPLPVYTGVIANWNMPNHWFEFTPFEVGSRWLNAYIPTWSFGRKFKNGKSVSSAPEQTMGFMLAIFGSAFAATMEETYDKCVKYLKAPKWLAKIPGGEKMFVNIQKMFKEIVKNTEIGELRVSWAQVFNYVYKMKNFDIRKEKDMKFADAGVDFDNPVFVTYRRPPHGGAPDAVFVFNAGDGVDFSEVELLSQYAARHSLPFPEVTPSDVENHAMTVYGDGDDPDVPLIFYMPRIVDRALLDRYMDDPDLGDMAHDLAVFDIDEAIHYGFAGTYNFDYKREEVELMASMTEFNMRALAQEIKTILKRRLELKRALRLKNQ